MTVLPRVYTTDTVKLLSYIVDTVDSKLGFSLEYKNMGFLFRAKLVGDAEFTEITTPDFPLRRWLNIAISYSNSGQTIEVNIGGS